MQHPWTFLIATRHVYKVSRKGSDFYVRTCFYFGLSAGKKHMPLGIDDSVCCLLVNTPSQQISKFPISMTTVVIKPCKIVYSPILIVYWKCRNIPKNNYNVIT